VEEVHVTEVLGGGEMLGVEEKEINLSDSVTECNAAAEILTRGQT